MFAIERLPIGFYSGDPRKRVIALANITEDGRVALLNQVPEWPAMSPGSLNAWVVFLGASPGGSPGGAWTYDPRPSVGGAHPGVAEYVDGRGFWNGIREYAGAIFHELATWDAYAATMVRNLDPVQSATAPKGRRMHAAAKQVVDELGKVIRPRLVIAIGSSRKYTDAAFRELPGLRKRQAGVLYSASARKPLQWHSLVGCWDSGDPFLYVSPAGIHPSLRHVSQGDTLGFLRKHGDEARALRHQHGE